MAIIQTDENAGTPSTTSGDIAQSGAAQSQAQGAGGAAQGGNQSGSNFTNLQSYLDANSGNVATMGQNLQSKADDTAKSIRLEGQKAEDKVSNSAGKFDNDLFNRGYNAPGNFGEADAWKGQFKGPGAKATLDRGANEKNAQFQQVATSDLGDPSALGLLTGVTGKGDQRFDSMLLNASGQKDQTQAALQKNAKALQDWLDGSQARADAGYQQNADAYNAAMGSAKGQILSDLHPVSQAYRDTSGVQGAVKGQGGAKYTDRTYLGGQDPRLQALYALSNGAVDGVVDPYANWKAAGTTERRWG